jgi:hypothetical protein
MFYKIGSLIVITTCSCMAQAEGSFSFITGMDYSSGHYGQSEKTRITYVPFITKYVLNDQWTFKAVVPWLTIDGPGAVSADSRIITGTASSRRTRESGLGDIVLGTTYSALQFNDQKLYLDLGFKVKVPTASESKGLGTGKTDYTITADLYKTLDRLTLLGTVGYKVLGDPSGVNLYNVWFSTVGAVYKIDDKNNVGATLDLRQATTANNTGLREYTIFYSHKFDQRYKLQTYMVAGDTTSSVDFGAGAMLAISW